MWFSRTLIMVQYWRSMDQLMAYATSKQAAHLPAWKAFNQSVGTDGTVGIWHETFAVAAGAYESVYVSTCLPLGWAVPAVWKRRLGASIQRRTDSGVAQKPE
jgi:hypothetical protein